MAAALVLIGCSARAGPNPAATGNPRQGTFSGLISIGGARKLFMRCAGRGGPTVIMVAGIQASSDSWTTVLKPPEPSVFQDVSRFTHVCACDRPGTLLNDGRLSQSTPVPMPRTLPDIAAELHRLLISAGLRSPVVLVGHSLGGLISRYFAQTYRKEVRGTVFVDALGSNIASLLGPVWWPRYAHVLNFPFGPSYPYPPGFERVDMIGAIRAAQRATPPRMPLVVISKTVPFPVPRGAYGPIVRHLNKVWPIMQDRLVSLEPQTPHIWATGSSHSVHTFPPDLLASVIRLIWDRARACR